MENNHDLDEQQQQLQQRNYYKRSIRRYAISIDYLLRIKLGLPVNPEGLLNPQPVSLSRVLNYLNDVRTNGIPGEYREPNLPLGPKSPRAPWTR